MSWKKAILGLFSFEGFFKPNRIDLTSGKSYEDKQKEHGVFEYDPEGFSIQFEDFFAQVKWQGIAQINVYKRDLMTIDRIEMEIIYGDKSITISEDLPGWYQFNLRLESALPLKSKDWYWEVVQPAFATNWRTIYERH